MLEEIETFINKINHIGKQPIYNFDDVEIFLADSYTEKIDFFAQLFTIYKSQIKEAPNCEINTNYYNLDSEIKRFKNRVPSDNLEDLNKIRIFNNSNAAFLSSYLMSHFEVFSFCLTHDQFMKKLEYSKPLLFCTSKLNPLSNNLSINNFEFYLIIERVFENVCETVNTVVQFYLDHLILNYPPKTFVKNPFFSHLDKNGNGSFQFRLIITRHITYLEGFRRSIIEDIIVKYSTPEKIEINKYLTNIIISYIDLYKRNYLKILASLSGNDNLMDQMLSTTYEYLLKRERLALKIRNSGFIDFTTTIQVDNL